MGQGDVEGHPCPGPALGPDPPTVEFDERLRDRQPQPEAPRPRVEATEALEDRPQLPGGAAGASIVHREEDFIPRDPTGERDPRAHGGVLVGVGQQVHHHPLQPPRVPLIRQRLGDVDRERLALLLDQRVDRRQRLEDDGPQVEGLAVEAPGARLELIEGEQLVDLPVEPLDVAPDVVQQVPLGGLEPVGHAQLEQADPGPGRGEGGAQVVGDRRDEVPPQPVQLHEPFGLQPVSQGRRLLPQPGDEEALVDIADRLRRLLLQRQPPGQEGHADREEGQHGDPGDQQAAVDRRRRPHQQGGVDPRGDGRDGGRIEQGGAERQAHRRAIDGHEQEQEERPAGLGAEAIEQPDHRQVQQRHDGVGSQPGHEVAQQLDDQIVAGEERDKHPGRYPCPPGRGLHEGDQQQQRDCRPAQPEQRPAQEALRVRVGLNALLKRHRHRPAPRPGDRGAPSTSTSSPSTAASAPTRRLGQGSQYTALRPPR